MVAQPQCIGFVNLSAGAGTSVPIGFIIGSCKGPDVFARVLSVCEADSINVDVINSQLAIVVIFVKRFWCSMLISYYLSTHS